MFNDLGKMLKAQVFIWMDSLSEKEILVRTKIFFLGLMIWSIKFKFKIILPVEP